MIIILQIVNEINRTTCKTLWVYTEGNARALFTREQGTTIEISLLNTSLQHGVANYGPRAASSMRLHYLQQAKNPSTF